MEANIITTSQASPVLVDICGEKLNNLKREVTFLF